MISAVIAVHIGSNAPFPKLLSDIEWWENMIELDTKHSIHTTSLLVIYAMTPAIPNPVDGMAGNYP